MGKRTKAAIAAAAAVFLCSTLFFCKVNPAQALTAAMIDEKELGEICIEQIIPHADIESENQETEVRNTKEQSDSADTPKHEEETGSEDDEIKTSETVVTGDPLVIIYHTHSSESYMPYSESNYHREAEEGTVRDVGDILENELKKKGINVIHDKTVHDRPSYNESYTRSLETIQKLVKQYPSALYIIDLHRDAAPADASEGKLVEIDGQRVAKFSLVVGKANENYGSLINFAKEVSSKAGELYDGYGGAIIEKDYNYNQFVADNALLLEVGNNKNSIEEARLCGKYFADALAAVISEQ